MRTIDADKACKAIENFRIKKDTYGSLMNEWDHGYNCGLERAEDEMQDFIVEAIPVEWINKYANEHRAYIHAFAEMVVCWSERKEE